jgi:hypothetical protein
MVRLDRVRSYSNATHRRWSDPIGIDPGRSAISRMSRTGRSRIVFAFSTAPVVGGAPRQPDFNSRGFTPNAGDSRALTSRPILCLMGDTRWFAKRLNEELAERGMSYIELGKELGVSHQPVYGWTRGISLPQFTQFQDVCEYLDWPHPARPVADLGESRCRDSAQTARLSCPHSSAGVLLRGSLVPSRDDTPPPRRYGPWQTLPQSIRYGLASVATPARAGGGPRIDATGASERDTPDSRLRGSSVSSSESNESRCSA